MTQVTPLFSAAAGKISSTSATTVALGLATAATATAISILCLRDFTLSGREKLIHRELEVLEERAGIIGITGAFLVGHTEIIGRHQQLNITLQLDDAELSQRYKKLATFAVDHQIFFKATANIGRDIGGGRTAITTGIQRFAAKNNRIDHFHNGYRQIGALRILQITGIPTVIRAENTSTAFAAKQHRTFVINS